MVYIESPRKDAFLEKKRDLERQLEQDVQELELLQTSLVKTDGIVEHMAGLLQAFDSRLGQLEHYIIPIHNATQNLTQIHRNMDGALEEIDRYLSHFTSAEEEGKVIARGVDIDRLDGYINAIQRMKNSLFSLQSSRCKSADKGIAMLKNQLWRAIQQLEECFVNKAVELSDPIPTHSNSTADLEIIKMPEKSLAILQLLGGHLSMSLVDVGPVTTFQRKYEEIRANFLAKSLSPMLSAAKEQDLKWRDNVIYNKGSSALLRVLILFFRLVWLEREYHSRIMQKERPDDIARSFSNIFQPTLDNNMELAESLLMRARKNIQKKDYSDMFILIDLVCSFEVIAERYASLISVMSSKETTLQSWIEQGLVTIISSFREFYEDIANEGLKQSSALSPDGTVNKLTSVTINTLKRMQEYRVEVDEMILNSWPKLQGKANFGLLPSSISSFTEFEMQVIQCLVQTMEQKAKGYKKVALMAIFLLNNFNYINKNLKHPSFTELLEMHIKKQLDQYRMTWNEITLHLSDPFAELGKDLVLTKPQRDTIKDRFKFFNSALEDVYKSQKEYVIPDSDLRQQTLQEIKKLLVPPYRRFHERYTIVEFTKNPEKHIKYSPITLEEMVDKFFDSSA